MSHIAIRTNEAVLDTVLNRNNAQVVVFIRTVDGYTEHEVEGVDSLSDCIARLLNEKGINTVFVDFSRFLEKLPGIKVYPIRFPHMEAVNMEYQVHKYLQQR